MGRRRRGPVDGAQLVEKKAKFVVRFIRETEGNGLTQQLEARFDAADEVLMFALGLETDHGLKFVAVTLRLVAPLG